MYRKSKRGRTLVGKGGRITPNSKKNVENFKQSIRDREDLTESQKRALLSDVDSYVSNYSRRGKKLTTSGFYSYYEKDRIHKMLTNAGYTAEELANEIGVSEEDILNSSNWNGTRFMGAWELEFNYTTSLLRYVEEEN